MELDEDGSSTNAGYAPYLDYSPASPAERETLLRHAENLDWLKGDVEAKAMDHAIDKLVPDHLEEVRVRRQAIVEKTEKAVRQRLTAEIQHWDYRANELRQMEKAGKRNARLNSEQAARRAENLAARLEARMAELAGERQISALPPRVAGGALIVPKGLLARLLPASAPTADVQADVKARQEIEAAAMAAVMRVERRLGFVPTDVSGAKCGYDIESSIPVDLRGEGGESLRFVEVKGRAEGAETVTVSRNEILTALNQPGQFILALVEVDGGTTRTTYLKNPFTNPPDFASNGVTFDIDKLLGTAEIVYREED